MVYVAVVPASVIATVLVVTVTPAVSLSVMVMSTLAIDILLYCPPVWLALWVIVVLCAPWATSSSTAVTVTVTGVFQFDEVNAIELVDTVEALSGDTVTVTVLVGWLSS